MIRDIMRDPLFLGQKAEKATCKDLSVGRDLEETLAYHREHCLGMAANMIGINKRIIAFVDGKYIRCMYNPYVVKASGAYQTEESCLSLVGSRACTRYAEIEVTYTDKKGHSHKGNFRGLTAQIIQHEIDHCDGVVI